MTDQRKSSETTDSLADTNVHGAQKSTVDVVLSQDETHTVIALLAHSELAAQLRLAIDASRAPSAELRMRQSALSGASYLRLTALISALEGSKVDGETIVRGYDSAFDEYEQRTKAETWHERVLKGYVGHAVSVDFGKIVMRALPEGTQQKISDVIASSQEEDFAAEILSADSKNDSVLASRLALWGRRLVGEALNQIQQLVAEHPDLAHLVRKAAQLQGVEVVGESKEDNAKLVTGWVFNQITAAHSLRMARIGLAA